LLFKAARQGKISGQKNSCYAKETPEILCNKAVMMAVEIISSEKIILISR
jgi:hypothetical protein